MPGAMRCSRSSALLGRMILMRRISMASKTGVAEQPGSDHRSHPSGDAAAAPGARDAAKLPMRSGGPVLPSDQSAILRERLLGQLVTINSADEAAAWAHQNLSAKNSLTADDARIVEEEFRMKVSTIGDGEGACEQSSAVLVRNVMPSGPPDAVASEKTSKGSGKPARTSAVRAWGKTVR